MADSKRKQIMDRILVTLAAITVANGYNTTVKSVSETIRQYNEFKQSDIPALVPMDLDEVRETVAYPSGSSYGQQGIMTLRVSAVVYDHFNSTRTKRLNLMQDIEKALLNDSTLDAYGLEIDPTRVVTDDGTIKNYSVWDQYFIIRYYYNRSNGG